MSESISLGEHEKPLQPESTALTEGSEKTGDIREKILQNLIREYISHPLDNPKVKVRQIPELGRAVFAQENMQAGEVVAAFAGAIHKAKKISDLPNDPPDFMRDHVIQIGREEYLHGKGGLAELINHSCDPNCGIKEKSIIVTMRDIKAGEQLTWDYAMTEDSDWYFQGCLCGSEECRGTIGPYRDLPMKIQEKYKAFTSQWVLDAYSPPQLEIKTFVENIPDEIIEKITELFRYTFSNDWPQYVVCPPCDASKPEGMRLKASQVYQTGDQPLPISAQEEKQLVPECPCCQQKMTLYMDPQKTAEKIRKKLEKNAVVTIIQDKQKNEILGFTFGRKWTLKEAFEAEEWHHPYAYTAQPSEEYEKSFEDFLVAVSPAIKHVMLKTEPPLIEINANTEVFLHNCTVTHSRIRGKGLMPKMMQDFQSAVPESMKNIPVIGETDKNSRFEKILQMNGSVSIEGFLHPSLVLMIAHHGTSINNFARQKTDLRNVNESL